MPGLEQSKIRCLKISMPDLLPEVSTLLERIFPLFAKNYSVFLEDHEGMKKTNMP